MHVDAQFGNKLWNAFVRSREAREMCRKKYASRALFFSHFPCILLDIANVFPPKKKEGTEKEAHLSRTQRENDRKVHPMCLFLSPSPSPLPFCRFHSFALWRTKHMRLSSRPFSRNADFGGSSPDVSPGVVKPYDADCAKLKWWGIFPPTRCCSRPPSSSSFSRCVCFSCACIFITASDRHL